MVSLADFPLVGDERIATLLRHWQAVRGDRRMPRRSDIDPAAIRTLLPNVWLCDYEPVERRFRYRLCGEAIAGIFGAWALSALLIRTKAGAALSRLGGLSFWIFCGHYPLLLLFWMVWNRLGIADYPLFYAAAPLLALAILVISHAAARRFAPSLHAILTGRRVGGRTPPAERPSHSHPQPPMKPAGSIAQRR